MQGQASHLQCAARERDLYLTLFGTTHLWRAWQKLDEEELEKLKARYQRRQTEVVRLLEKYDVDGDGVLDDAELKPLKEGLELINRV